MSKAVISRRDFLKLSGYGLMGVFLPELSPHFPHADDFANLEGRIINRTVWTHDEPNSKARRARLYWHDLVVPILNTTVGDDESAYNRVWYQLGDGGYAYSGGIQPVRTILNEPQQIPIRGMLGEVSVPFTDAYAEADLTTAFMYRLYYETVHWDRRLHVGFNVLDRSGLIDRKLVREGVFEFLLPVRIGTKGVAGHRLARGVELQQLLGHVAHGLLHARLGFLPRRPAQPVERGA